MRRVRRRRRRGRVSRCDHGGYGRGSVQPWEGTAMGVVAIIVSALGRRGGEADQQRKWISKCAMVVKYQ